MNQQYLLVLPIFVVFGIPAWVMFFLQTYRHFPKMEPAKRLSMSIVNATILTAVLLGVVFIAWLFAATQITKGAG